MGIQGSEVNAVQAYVGDDLGEFLVKVASLTAIQTDHAETNYLDPVLDHVDWDKATPFSPPAPGRLDECVVNAACLDVDLHGVIEPPTEAIHVATHAV